MFRKREITILKINFNLIAFDRLVPCVVEMGYSSLKTDIKNEYFLAFL